MKCTVPGAHIKVLARAVQSLARIGDDLYVEPGVNSISFRSVNTSRSAYASFTFRKSFFAFYNHDPSLSCNPSQEDSSKCKISMRSCLPIFRSPVMLDRKVENCIMHFDDGGCKLVFEMRFRHGISKTHILPVIECETLQVTYTKDSALNCLQAQVQLFLDVTQNFLSSQEEVTLLASSQKTSICSYVDRSKSSSKTRSTEIVLDPDEFNKYEVTNETAITFCLKEFRALLTFAEAMSQLVESYFETGGKPVVFGVQEDGLYEASFVLSTLTPDVDLQLSNQKQVQSQNSNNSTVHNTAKSPKENITPSTIKQKKIQLSDSNASAVNHIVPPERIAEIEVCSLEELGKSSLRNVRSPGLLQAKRSNNSLLNRTEETRLERSCLSEEIENKSKEKIEKTESYSGVNILVNKPNNSRTENNQFSSSSKILSQKITSKDQNSMVENFNSSEISNGSSFLLQIRESDNDDNDLISCSLQPPRKRLRISDIFDSTFDPCKVPGYNIILAEDSGDERR